MSAMMKWYCMDCREKFDGPKDRSPGSCPSCGSAEIFDINVEPAELPPFGTFIIIPIQPVLHGKN